MLSFQQNNRYYTFKLSLKNYLWMSMENLNIKADTNAMFQICTENHPLKPKSHLEFRSCFSSRLCNYLLGGSIFNSFFAHSGNVQRLRPATTTIQMNSFIQVKLSGIPHTLKICKSLSLSSTILLFQVNLNVY